MIIVDQKKFEEEALGAPVDDQLHPIGRELKIYIKRNPNIFGTTTIRPLVHLLILFFGIMACFLSIFANFRIFAVPAFFIIGILQYHIAVAIHEASHYTLIRPKALNNVIGHFLCSLLGFDLLRYREHHFVHHRRYGTKSDPDWMDYQLDGKPRNLGAFLADVAFTYCFLGGILRLIRRTAVEKRVVFRALRIDSRLISLPMTVFVQFILFIILSMYTVWWHYFVFWVLPAAIFPVYFSMLRMFGEHGGLEAEAPQSQILFVRTLACNGKGIWKLISIFEKLTLAPFNFNLHHEHHWFPNVPYHCLPKIHELLVAKGHYQRFPQCYARSYFETIWRLLERRPVAAREL